MKRIGTNCGSAAWVAADRAQVVETLQTSAFALPVADGIIDKCEFAQAAEIRNREHRLENALQTGIVALIGQQIHLQEALVRLLLHLDQIRDGYRGLDLRKIN